MKTSNNLVGTAGEYYVCGEICRRGYLALITPKNNPLFDIVASNPEGTRSIAIQVKTRSIQNDQGWKLGKDVALKRNKPNLFVVLVNLKEEGLPEFFVYEGGGPGSDQRNLLIQRWKSRKQGGIRGLEVRF